jgi:hypothetical protein
MTKRSPPPPTKIMLIRHAEKPPKSPNKSGPWDIREDGTRGKGHCLIVAGWERAGALIGFFAPYKAVPVKPKVATPDYIYAADPKGETERPCATVTPLARWLKYTPGSPKFNMSYDVDKGEKQLADDVLLLSGRVLICWEHHHIIDIVDQINEKYPISNYEELKRHPWPDVFGLVWVLDYDAKQNQYTWAHTHQHLMPDDIDG